MGNAYRIAVELPNGAKFRAQGDVADVRVDAETFYSRLLNVPAPTTPRVAPKANGAVARGEHADNDKSTQVETDLPLLTETDSTAFDRSILDRLFAKDKHGTVSLTALPSGENAECDALVALVYGAAKLGGEQQVTGSRLKKAAKQSGLHQVDRIDRSLATAIGQYLTTAGFKKGRRYGLTNPGIRRAEEILKGILN
jgi:hypothetical protein